MLYVWRRFWSSNKLFKYRLTFCFLNLKERKKELIIFVQWKEIKNWGKVHLTINLSWTFSPNLFLTTQFFSKYKSKFNIHYNIKRNSKVNRNDLLSKKLTYSQGREFNFCYQCKNFFGRWYVSTFASDVLALKLAPTFVNLRRSTTHLNFYFKNIYI